MKEATLVDVVLAGGSGGLGYWAFALFRGGAPAGEVAPLPPETWLWASAALSMVLGALAAFLMVFFVAMTNTKERMRAIGFAVACGLCWDAVLTGLSQRFTGEYGDRRAAKVLQAAQNLAPQPEATPAPDQAAEAAADLIKSVPTVQNPVLKGEIQREAALLLESVQGAPLSPAKTDALRTIGIAAVEAKQALALTSTVRTLESIADTAPEHAPDARAALAEINKRVLEAAEVPR